MVPIRQQPRGMLMNMNALKRGWMAALAAGGMAAGIAPAAAQGTGTTFKATASVKAPGKSASVPVTIRIDRFISEADRDKVVAAVKSGAAGEPQKTFAALPACGYIEVVEKRTPLKYAYARSTGGGRLITAVTAKAIHYIGGAEKGATPDGGDRE